MDTISQNRINSLCLMVLTGIAVTSALIYTKTIFVPFVISMFIYLALVPSLSFLQIRLKISHALAVLIIATIFLALSALVILLLVQSFESVFAQTDMYRSRVLELVTRVTEVTPSWLSEKLDPESIRNQLAQIPVLNIVRGATGDLFGILGNSTLVIIFTLFLLAGDPSKIENPIFKEFQGKVSRYVVAKTFLSALTALITMIVFVSIGADLALMFAMLTFLLNFIPNIGSIVAIALPLPILYLQFALGPQFWVALGVCGVAQFTIGNILEPKMLGDSLDLHPVTVLLFLMFWGLVWGIPGMFLAVPITSLLKILFGRIEVTKPVAELLAGRF